MGRTFWFAVGAGAGLYGSLKARRFAYRVSPTGLADQAAALRLGALSLLADVRTAAQAREAELLDELGLARREPPRRTGAVPLAAPGAPPAPHVLDKDV